MLLLNWEGSMNLTFEEAVNRLETAPGGTLVVPVRITAHGEDGVVLYGYGGLGYQAPEPRYVVVSGSSLFTQADSFGFVIDRPRLVTEGILTNQRVRVLNNLAYDPNRPDDWSPPTYQSFLINRFERATVEIGWAVKRPDLLNRRLILRVTRGVFPDFTGVDVEVDQQGAFLTGLGALSATTAAVWTASFLDPIPRAGNEIG